ncbi:MAG: hypothetical protein JO244_14135 [Solirubrobacterales bacterium]|nr:hypothetical protein [Solirubrobacterales bacterium]
MRRRIRFATSSTLGSVACAAELVERDRLALVDRPRPAADLPRPLLEPRLPPELLRELAELLRELAEPRLPPELLRLPFFAPPELDLLVEPEPPDPPLLACGILPPGW